MISVGGFWVLTTPERLIIPLQWRGNYGHTSSFGASLETCLQAAQKMLSFQEALACGSHCVTLCMLSLPRPAGSFVPERQSWQNWREKEKKGKERKEDIYNHNHSPQPIHPNWTAERKFMGCDCSKRKWEQDEVQPSEEKRRWKLLLMFDFLLYLLCLPVHTMQLLSIVKYRFLVYQSTCQ